MYAFWLRKKISSKHLLSRKGVHFHRKNRFSHNKKTNHRKNRFSHKKKTNLRLLDTPNELITLLYRTSSHTTISLTPVKIYPSSVNEMHLNFSFFNDISIVSSSFRAGVLAFHGTWHLILNIAVHDEEKKNNVYISNIAGVCIHFCNAIACKYKYLLLNSKTNQL